MKCLICKTKDKSLSFIKSIVFGIIAEVKSFIKHVK